MYVDGLVFFIFLTALFLTIWLVQNLLTLLELLRIHRLIIEGKRSVFIPFSVLKSQPMHGFSTLYATNEVYTFCGTPAVHGLITPLQLHASPLSNVRVKLKKNTTVLESRSGVADGGLGSVAGGSSPVHSLGTGSRNAGSDVLSVQSPPAGSVTPELLPSLLDRIGLFASGAACRGGQSSGSRQSNDVTEGRGGLQHLMNWPELSLSFMLDSIPQLGAAWLRRVGSAESSPAQMSKSIMSPCFRSVCESTMPFLDSNTVTEVSTSNVTVIDAGGSNSGLSGDLRGVCFIGADDVDIMRAITADTIQTFGNGSLSYRCYYTVEDEANCDSWWMQLDGSRSQQQFDTNAQLGGPQPFALTPSLCSFGDAMVHTTLQQYPGRDPLKRENKCGQLKNLALLNCKSTISPRESFGSFMSTLTDRAASRSNSRNSNTHTWTFVENVATDGGNTFKSCTEDHADRDMVRRQQQRTNLNDRKQDGLEMEEEMVTKASDDGSSAIPASPTSLISSSWAVFSTSDTASVANNGGHEESLVAASPYDACRTDLHDKNGCIGITDEWINRPSVGATDAIAVEVSLTEAQLTQGRLGNRQDPIEPLSSKQQVERGTTAVAAVTYKGCMYITPSPSDTRATSPGSFKGNAVKLTLATLLKRYVERYTHEENKVLEATRKKETVHSEECGNRINEEVKKGELVAGCVHPLTLAFLLSQKSAPIHSGAAQKNWLPPYEDGEPDPKDCLVYVYTTASTMRGDTLVKGVGKAVTDDVCRGNRILKPREYSLYPSIEVVSLGQDEARTSLPSAMVYGDAMDSVHKQCEMKEFNSMSGMEEMVERPPASVRGEVCKALLEAMQGEEGVELPMVLQYVRVGEALYAVKEISDCTFLQHRWESIPIKSRDGDLSYRPGYASRIHEKSSGVVDHSPVGRQPLRCRKGTATDPSVSPSQAVGSRETVRMCWLCMLTEASVILLPCAHFAVCYACSEMVQKCCLCRQDVEATIVLYNEMNEFSV